MHGFVPFGNTLDYLRRGLLAIPVGPVPFRRHRGKNGFKIVGLDRKTAVFHRHAGDKIADISQKVVFARIRDAEQHFCIVKQCQNNRPLKGKDGLYRPSFIVKIMALC